MIRKIIIISFVVLLLSSQPIWASSGCPEGWTAEGEWYPEGNTCKRRCSQLGQEDWWMDSGGEARPGCEDLRDPAPTYFDVWGRRQAPLGDCPEGFEPEHVWFEERGTCLLDCVGTGKVDPMIGVGFDWKGWLDIPRSEKQVYMDSGGESRPPWCILD